MRFLLDWLKIARLITRSETRQEFRQEFCLPANAESLGDFRYDPIWRLFDERFLLLLKHAQHAVRYQKTAHDVHCR